MNAIPSALARFHRGIARSLALLAVATLASCGGGVDSGGTGATASSYASGPISGFGSVIVNGVHYDESHATITDADGNVLSSADLRLGMTTQIRGGPIEPGADGAPTSVASTIVVQSELQGPVQANDAAAGTLVVLGQVVDVAATTVFDPAIAGGQAGLAIGDVVEVYGQLDVATGRYAATRIDRRSSGAPREVRGIVSALDTAARRFQLGTTSVSYASLPAAAVPATLADGRFVRVTLAAAPDASGTWIATRLVDGNASPGDHEDAKVRGRISAYASATSFAVDGTPVDAHGAEFPDGTAGLALGASVEVEGSTVSGVLVATRVRLDSSGDGDGGSGPGDDNGSGNGGGEFEITDVVSAVDAVAHTFVVRGVLVAWDGSTEFRDGTAADLAVGRRVEARGRLSADGTRVQASRVEFEDR